MTPEEKAYRDRKYTDKLINALNVLFISNAVLVIVFLLLLIFTSCTKPSEPVTPEPVAMHKSTLINLMPNMGGQSTQDWDSKSDAWTIRSGKGGIRSNSVYFAGNYLHVESRSQFSLISPKPINKAGWSEYTLSVKYRSTVPVMAAVKYADNCTFVIGTMPATDKVQRWTVKFKSGRVDWVKWYNKAVEKGEMQIDEVEVR